MAVVGALFVLVVCAACCTGTGQPVMHPMHSNTSRYRVSQTNGATIQVSCRLLSLFGPKTFPRHRHHILLAAHILHLLFLTLLISAPLLPTCGTTTLSRRLERIILRSQSILHCQCPECLVAYFFRCNTVRCLILPERAILLRLAGWRMPSRLPEAAARIKSTRNRVELLSVTSCCCSVIHVLVTICIPTCSTLLHSYLSSDKNPEGLDRAFHGTDAQQQCASW